MGVVQCLIERLFDREKRANLVYLKYYISIPLRDLK
jgi:hypothetical protein